MVVKFVKRDGIYCMETPQYVAIEQGKFLTLGFEEDGILQINGIKSIRIVNNQANVPYTDLVKGTNILLVKGETETMCQPLSVFAATDKKQITLATCLDVIELANRLQREVVQLKDRVRAVELQNPKQTREVLNKVVKVVTNLQTRLVELEKGYDPTQI